MDQDTQAEQHGLLGATTTSGPGEDARALRAREARLRRAVTRQGGTLVKSKSRDPRAVDFGGFMIVRNGLVEAGELGSPRALSIEEVEEWVRS